MLYVNCISIQLGGKNLKKKKKQNSVTLKASRSTATIHHSYELLLMYCLRFVLFKFDSCIAFKRIYSLFPLLSMPMLSVLIVSFIFLSLLWHLSYFTLFLCPHQSMLRSFSLGSSLIHSAQSLRLCSHPYIFNK